jgi:hypothetical protein
MPSFPAPKINTSRPSLSPCTADFIGGDFEGLQRLAGEIYGFVGRCDGSSGPFPALVTEVTRMVKDDDDPSGGYHPDATGGWIGAAAYTFRSAFVADAAMMNGLNRALCSIAAQVDSLAGGLSSLESGLEQNLENILRKGIDDFSLDWLGTTGSGTRPAFRLTAQGAAGIVNHNIPQSAVIQLCDRLGESYFEKADWLREQTSARLAALGETLVEALHYYRSESALAGSPSASDINVMLTSTQAGSDDAATGRLEDDLKKETGGLSGGTLNDPALKAELANLGVKAQNIGSLIGDLKDFKDADTALKTSKGFLGLVGDAVPLLMAIGLGA